MTKTNRIFNYIVLTGMLVLLVFGVAQPVAAFETNNNGRIAEGEVIDDDLFISAEKVAMNGTVNGVLFASGNRVNINGTVNGDVFAVGSTVTIGENAKISGNLFVGAQTVEVNGEVNGSVFTGGMSLTLMEKAVVGRNVFFGGFNFETKPGSVINRDVAAGGYQLILGGEVARDVKADSAAFKLDGTIGRNAQIQVEKPGSAESMPYAGPWSPQSSNIEMINPGLYIGEGASIGGDLVYTSPVDQSNALESTPQGSTVFQTPVPSEEETRKPSTNIKFQSGIYKTLKKMAANFISLMALGALALWLIPLTVKGVSASLSSKPMASLGYGFLINLVGWIAPFFAFALIIVLAIILGLVSFGGLGGFVFSVGSASLLMAFTIFMTLASWGSKIVLIYLTGRFILEKMFKQVDANRFLFLLIGVAIYVLFRAVPLFGWLMDVFITFFGLGAMWLYFRDRKDNQAGTEVTPAA